MKRKIETRSGFQFDNFVVHKCHHKHFFIKQEKKAITSVVVGEELKGLKKNKKIKKPSKRLKKKEGGRGSGWRWSAKVKGEKKKWDLEAYKYKVYVNPNITRTRLILIHDLFINGLVGRAEFAGHVRFCHP